MTIIAAFQCTDGLLMCADSEQTISAESKSQMRKVNFKQYDFGNIVFGSAGDSSLIDYVEQKIVRDLYHTPQTLNSFEGWLLNYAQEIFDRHIHPYAAFPHDFIPELQMLIGIQMEGQYRLYKWERNFVYQVEPNRHTSVGIGTLQSESLISDYHHLFLPGNQMFLYAVRLMLRVKQLVQGCGGKTEVVFLGNDGQMRPLATFGVDAVERLVERVDNFFLSYVMKFVSGAGEAGPYMDEQALLRGQAEFLERYRTSYQNLAPQWNAMYGFTLNDAYQDAYKEFW